MNVPIFQSEDQLQAFCWQWAVNTYPQVRKLLFAVPNQKGTRNKIEMMKLKSMGVTKGISDLVLIRLTKPGVGLEAKFGKNGLSDDQEEVKARWPEYYAFWTFEEFKTIFEALMRAGL